MVAKLGHRFQTFAAGYSFCMLVAVCLVVYPAVHACVDRYSQKKERDNTWVIQINFVAYAWGTYRVPLSLFEA